MFTTNFDQLLSKIYNKIAFLTSHYQKKSRAPRLRRAPAGSRKVSPPLYSTRLYTVLYGLYKGSKFILCVVCSHIIADYNLHYCAFLPHYLIHIIAFSCYITWLRPSGRGALWSPARGRGATQFNSQSKLG